MPDAEIDDANAITERVIWPGISVHRWLGPGPLESVC